MFETVSVIPAFLPSYSLDFGQLHRLQAFDTFKELLREDSGISVRRTWMNMRILFRCQIPSRRYSEIPIHWPFCLYSPICFPIAKGTLNIFQVLLSNVWRWSSLRFSLWWASPACRNGSASLAPSGLVTQFILESLRWDQQANQHQGEGVESKWRIRYLVAHCSTNHRLYMYRIISNPSGRLRHSQQRGTAGGRARDI